jgi:flagellar protein FlaG
LPGQSSQAPAVPERANVEQAVAKVKVQIQAISNNSLDFAIDDSSGKTIVRVTDRESGELIRQIPSQEMLEIARSLDRLQGILVKQKA